MPRHVSCLIVRGGRIEAHRPDNRSLETVGWPELRAIQREKRRRRIGAPMADTVHEALARALHEGHELEHEQRWEEAVAVYSKLLTSLGPASNRESRAMRAIAFTRAGNALMELRRWDDARVSLDKALHEAKGSGDPAIVAQVLLGAGVFA